MSSVLPQGWEETFLGEVGEFSKGKGIAKKEVVSTGIPCIRYAEIYTDYDFVVRKVRSFITADTASNSKKLKHGDIVFAGSGETVEDIGKSVAYMGYEDAYVGGDTVVLSPSKSLDSSFLSYQLNDDLRRMILPTKTGHSVKRVNYRKAEVNDEQENNKEQGSAAATYTGV